MTLKNDRPRLSVLEHAVMQLVWERQRLTADEVRSALGKAQELKDSTVRTILRRLEVKGYVEHDVDGRTYVYRPRIEPQSVATQQVRSIVDRFLEHSRVYVFGPDDDCQIYLSSADWMPRNFYRRVEVMFPIEAPDLRERILHEILPAHLMDNVKARILQPDGTYVRAHPPEGGIANRCQERLLALHPAAAPPETRVFGNGAPRHDELRVGLP